MSTGSNPRRMRRAAISRLFAWTAALAAVCAGPGCQSIGTSNPVRITLVNRSGAPVTGALLRFDRDIHRVDRLSRRGFEGARLRLDPPDTLRLEGGELEIEEAVTYEVIGVDGPPVLLEGRWLVDGEFGPKLTEREIR